MKPFGSLIALFVASIFGANLSYSQNITINAYPSAEEMVCAVVSETAFPDSILSSVNSEQVGKFPMELTAKDFIEKVYGVLSPRSSKDDICENCKKLLNLTPSEEDMGLWLDGAEGYQLNYYGLRLPDVSAIAQLENDSVASYGFFFMFPYDEASKEQMNRRQAEFCGLLLQEMHDMGVVFGMGAPEDSLFEAIGDYKGNYVDVRLADESASDKSGRYILYFMVEPEAYTPSDALTAL